MSMQDWALPLSHFTLQFSFLQTGDAPVCDPRKFYECVLRSLKNYVRDNQTSKCNCPRQCYRMTYQTTVSQAKMAASVASYMHHAFSLNGTVDDIINDYSMVEVCEPANYSRTCNTSPGFNYRTITSDLDPLGLY